MALTELQEAQVHKLLTAFCDRVPARVRDRLRHDFRISGNSVELFEVRPRYDRPSEWMEEPVAKFRYVGTRKVWELYCQFRDLKWHRYQPRPEAQSFQALLNEVEKDPTCIFWG